MTKVKVRYTSRALCAKEGFEEEVDAQKAARYVKGGVAVVVAEKKKAKVVKPEKQQENEEV